MKRRAFLAIALAGCSRPHKRTIAVVPKGNAHLFWQSVHAGAEAAGRETGVDVLWNGPAVETDYNGQLKIVDAMINRRVDSIALAPIDRKAMVSVVERASRERIPVVIFDSGIDTDLFVSQVATDNYQAGVMAADRMDRILAGKGKVAIVATQPGGASTMAREEGFEETVRQKYPELRIVDKQFGNSDFALSLAKAENMLTAHPDLAGMFASNESSSVGAAQALKARRGKVKLVGFDWSPTLLEDLKSGLIDSLVIQDPYKMGYESVKTAVLHLDGKPVTKINNLPPTLIHQANLDTPEIQAQVNRKL